MCVCAYTQIPLCLSILVEIEDNFPYTTLVLGIELTLSSVAAGDFTLWATLRGPRFMRLSPQWPDYIVRPCFKTKNQTKTTNSFVQHLNLTEYDSLTLRRASVLLYSFFKNANFSFN